ncbi:MAG TPA: PIN domain-containing protein, partial [Negativicutes bacterium]
MSKYYVLDTNVLLNSPNAIFAFNEHHVIIPEVVLEELDRFKKETTDRGANSRQTSRLIDTLRAQGNLLEGVPLNAEGGILQIETNYFTTIVNKHWDKNKPDNRILQVCKGLTEQNKEVILVSQDTNMRVKASILNIYAEDFRNEKVAFVEDQYTGRLEVYTSSEVINFFHEDDANFITPDMLSLYDEMTKRLCPVDLTTNQFLLIKSTDKDRHTAVGRFDGQKIVHLRYRNRNPFGVIPRNVGQIFMQECLMMSAEQAPLIIIKGISGTAKTFYSLAVGLHKYMDCRPREYHHLLICRPNIPMDEEIGFLPGSEAEKISPYMRGIRDNLFTLLSGNSMNEEKEIAHIEDTVQMFFDKRLIQTEALAYQRGRSVQKYWM